MKRKAIKSRQGQNLKFYLYRTVFKRLCERNFLDNIKVAVQTRINNFHKQSVFPCTFVHRIIDY